MTDIERMEAAIPLVHEVWIPGHLTRGLFGGLVALVGGVYAVYQFSKVESEEVKALIMGP